MHAIKNTVQLIGHLAAKPQLVITSSGKPVTRFSVATHESYRNNHGKKITEIQWHHVVAFGRQAEIAARYFDRGREIAIEGRLVSRSYADKLGNPKYITEIQINELLMLGTELP